MKYCTTCLYPETKPDIWFDYNGECSACNAYKNRKNINWEERDSLFKKLVQTQKDKRLPYDCIIPVSGGKDSTYQAIKCRDMGLHPLLVNAETCHLSSIGRRNLNNLVSLGFDLVTVSVDRGLRRELNKYALEMVGDISWPEHVLIFTVPIREASARGIDLIIYGENPQNEYGGPIANQGTDYLDRRWLAEFGGLNGLRLTDVIDVFEHYKRNKFTQFMYPVQSVKSIFLGHFYPWDGAANAEVAIQNGFELYYPCVEGSGFDYENLDNYQTGIHDYFKYIKYGFGRATDICSNRIRRGLMSREDGLKHCYEWDGEFPYTYLGRYLEEVLKPIGLTYHQFIQISKQFVNKDLFDTSQMSEHNPSPVPKFILE